VNGVMHLNEAGPIVAWTWRDLPNHVPNGIWDAFVVMPNRVHGTIIITSRPPTDGVGILAQVPWEELCAACLHFGDWIRKLEAL
jgi:hypothetical protein